MNRDEMFDNCFPDRKRAFPLTRDISDPPYAYGNEQIWVVECQMCYSWVDNLDGHADWHRKNLSPKQQNAEVEQAIRSFMIDHPTDPRAS